MQPSLRWAQPASDERGHLVAQEPGALGMDTLVGRVEVSMEAESRSPRLRDGQTEASHQGLVLQVSGEGPLGA